MISELAIFNYLDVAHTSRHVRSVLKANTSRICNLGIISRYWFTAQYLQTEIKSDWLVPNHDDIYGMEKAYGMGLESQFIHDCEKRHNHDNVKHFSLLGLLFPDETWEKDEEDLVRIKISGPGPQYLLLLEATCWIYATEKGIRIVLRATRRLDYGAGAFYAAGVVLLIS